MVRGLDQTKLRPVEVDASGRVHVEGTVKLQAEHQASVQGAYRMGNALEFVALPRELLEAEPLRPAIAVTHVNVPEAAWGQHVVLFATVQPSRRNHAAAPVGPRRG